VLSGFSGEKVRLVTNDFEQYRCIDFRFEHSLFEVNSLVTRLQQNPCRLNKANPHTFQSILEKKSIIFAHSELLAFKKVTFLRERKSTSDGFLAVNRLSHLCARFPHQCDRTVITKRGRMTRSLRNWSTKVWRGSYDITRNFFISRKRGGNRASTDRVTAEVNLGRAVVPNGPPQDMNLQKVQAAGCNSLNGRRAQSQPGSTSSSNLVGDSQVRFHGPLQWEGGPPPWRRGGHCHQWGLHRHPPSENIDQRWLFLKTQSGQFKLLSAQKDLTVSPKGWFVWCRSKVNDDFSTLREGFNSRISQDGYR
jgi:hypothetical protein